MTIQDGRYQQDSVEDILDAMLADAEEYWGEDLNDASLNTLEDFYRPIAERFAQTQADIGLVLDSGQLAHADGTALDLLTALIGISREEAEAATGTVRFGRDTAADVDYTIPSGVTVQTNSNDPIRFETTESATLTAGATAVDVPVVATEPGPHANVGANTLTVMPNPPAGIDSVTNPAGTVGGREAESDDELRERAETELAEGSRASAPALINTVRGLDGVTSGSIFINNGVLSQIDNGDQDGFEMVVAGGNDTAIAQAIRDTMAAGDTSWSGYNGTAVEASADLGNGQSLPTAFSRPTEVTIYVDADLTTTSEFDGEDGVRDAIVDYIGGLRSSGNEITGLGVGEDVIYTEVMARIQMVDGVHDVQNLHIDTTDGGTNQSNVTVGEASVATADATTDSLTFTTSDA
jgi:hypothetical protein